MGASAGAHERAFAVLGPEEDAARLTERFPGSELRRTAFATASVLLKV